MYVYELTIRVAFGEENQEKMVKRKNRMRRRKGGGRGGEGEEDEGGVDSSSSFGFLRVPSYFSTLLRLLFFFPGFATLTVTPHGLR